MTKKITISPTVLAYYSSFDKEQLIQICAKQKQRGDILLKKLRERNKLLSDNHIDYTKKAQEAEE